ncbi:MAG: ATP-binding cassette domain-containing protein [Acidobacteria bacterium]|nr:ATP-binding cassette domain-containing protein [Acidobacteriota bacterium]
MPEVAVQFHQVFYRLAGTEILSNLDLEIRQGETVVLLGRSGCGKTTTLKLVNRLLEPTSGEVRVEGRATTAWDPIQLRRRIGYVIQEVGLFPHFTVERNVALVPSLEKWDQEKISRRVRELLTLVGLEGDEYAHRYPWQLSGGQRQRVGVARALAVDPPILLMDEPFGALDPLTRSEIQEEFKELQGNLKKTILFVTHDLQEALHLGDRIGLMKEGRLTVISTADELLASQDPEVRAFLKPLQRASRAFQV